LLTDVPAHLLSLQEALVLLRERWQMELLYKLWKQYGRIDEWRTGNQWRILCELKARAHWATPATLAHHPTRPGRDEQRSLVKLAQVVRDTACSLLEALAGSRSLCSVLQSMKRSDAFRLPDEQAQETP
jgi:hypothetical protein